MSRGPGRQARRILAVLEAQPSVCLPELVGDEYRKAGYDALSCAAFRMAQNGRIDLYCVCHGRL